MTIKQTNRFTSFIAAAAVSLSLIAVSPSIASADTVNDIGFPFGNCETWYVYQGYQSGSHAGAYAFDLVKGSMSTTATAGATLVAPATGTIRTKYSIYSDGRYKGEGLRIGLADGTVISMDHLAEVTGLAVGSTISKGTYVAKVFKMPTTSGYSGVSHLHFEYFMPDGSRTPLIHGVWNYPATGPTSGNGVWSGTEIRSPCPPASTVDTVVDDGDAEFTSSAGWTMATGWSRSCTGYADDARWTRSRRAPNTDIVDWAKWTPNLSQSGQYEVWVFFPGIQNGIADTSSARYVVQNRKGANTVALSQGGNWCDWRLLGTFDFDAGSAGYVYLGDYTGGENPQTSVAADAVLWRRVGDIPNAPPNPPTLVSPANGYQANSATVVLQLQDAGDPDNYPRNYRDYIYYLELADGSDRRDSGWTTNTSWTFSLTGYGDYRWWAISGDGAVGSSPSAVRQLYYPAPPTVTPTSTPTNTPTATPTNTPSSTPTRTPQPRTVMIEAGHGVNGGSGSMSCDGLYAESDNTWAVANYAADYLRQSNLTVYVVRNDNPAMPQFAGSAFVSLHNDFCAPGAFGYKTSRYGGAPVTGQNGSNDRSDQLVASIWNNYGIVTGLWQDRAAGHFTADMLYYFGLNPTHAKGISSQTPGAIIELGWWSGDEYALLHRRQELGLGVAQSILAFLGEPLPPTATPTATNTATPTNTIPPTATDTPTSTPTSTPTATNTPPPTATNTPPPTATSTPTPIATWTPTATPTAMPPNPNGVKLAILPESVPAMLGIPVTVSVAMSNVADLGAFDFTLAFDPSIVNVQAVSQGQFQNTSGRTFLPVGPAIDNAAGTVSFGAFSLGDAPAGATGSGVIAYLRLMPVHTGTTSFNFTASGIASVSNTPIDHTRTGAVVNVTASCRWDADGDTDIDIFDVQEVARRWNSRAGQALYAIRFDFDTDGDIDIFDVQAVATRWNRRCSDLANAPSGAAPSLRSLRAVAPKDVAATVLIDPVDLRARQGDLFTVSVNITNASNLGGFEFSLQFSPTVAQVDSVVLGGFTGGTGRNVIALGPSIDNGTGTLTFGAFTLGTEPPGATGGGTLALIRMRALKAGTSPLTLTDAKYANVDNTPGDVTASSGTVKVESRGKAFLPKLIAE